MKPKPINIGDTVRYTRLFLRSTGEHTGAIPFARGIVTNLETLSDWTLASIAWGDPEVPERVNTFNLETYRSRR